MVVGRMGCVAVLVCQPKVSDVYKFPSKVRQTSHMLSDSNRLKAHKDKSHWSDDLSTLLVHGAQEKTCTLRSTSVHNSDHNGDGLKKDITLDCEMVECYTKLSGDGSKLAIACVDHTIRVHDTVTSAEWCHIAHDGDLCASELSMDDSKLLVHTYDKAAHLVETSNNKTLRRWELVFFK